VIIRSGLSGLGVMNFISRKGRKGGLVIGDWGADCSRKGRKGGRGGERRRTRHRGVEGKIFANYVI